MSGLEVAAAALIVGTGVEVGSRIDAANSEQDAIAREAALNNERADEILSRQQVNEDIIREKGREAELHIGGAKGLAGAGTGQKVKLRRTIQDTIVDTRRDAEFRAYMIRKGAEISMDLASDRAKGSILSGVGSVIKTGGTIGLQYARNDED